MRILVAENIAKNMNHNLWEINTDYGYQELNKINTTDITKELNI
jgi:hypothetical protein